MDVEPETKLKELNAKLQLLELKRAKGKQIVEKKNPTTIQRYREALTKLAKEVDETKLEIEQLKLQSGTSIEEVTEWSSGIEAKIEDVDAEIQNLDEYLNQARQDEDGEKRDTEGTQLAKQRAEQLEFEKKQYEMKLEYERKSEEFKLSKNTAGESNNTHAKLPKLSIAKFDGAYENWLPFWNKFYAEIESTKLPPVTKFAYLKELVVPKVKTDIDGLPFNTEGYERAKNILKSEYGNTSEIVNAYINNIMGLPVITGANPQRVDDFYKKLLYNVQSLETMGRLREVTGNVRTVLEKLKGIKADLVRGQDGWQDWDFGKLLQAIKRWKDINPVVSVVEESGSSHVPNRKNDRNDRYSHGRSLQTRQDKGHQTECVYCDSTDHKSLNCTKVTKVEDRKKILSQKRLCFNCTSGNHRAESCKSRNCQKCDKKHHTSICFQENKGRFMTAQNEKIERVVYPVVVVKVNGVSCRALLDTGAGSSYASAAILDHLGIQPVRKEFKRIEMMLGSSSKVIGVYNVTIDSLDREFHLETEVTKVDRETLLTLENPRYAEMVEKYKYLNGVKMDDMDEKRELPVHLILGISEYAKIKTETKPKIGQPGEPVAELTKFGWSIMSPGRETDLSNMFLTQTAASDYEELCRMDVLGLQDSPPGDQEEVYVEFKEQLRRTPEGWYETGLPWKGGHPQLPSNEKGSLKRLETLVLKLGKQGILGDYHDIIQQQLSQGIVEPVRDEVHGVEFYIPHKPVLRESAETTKLRIVYDASARAQDKAPSLNDCLNPGPPLQNELWSILVRARFHPAFC